MSDPLDEAADLAEQLNQSALANQLARARAQEAQLVIDGTVYCRSCRRPISLARLDALPNATRCFACESRRRY